MLAYGAQLHYGRFLLNRPKTKSSSLTKLRLKFHSNHELLQTETNYNICKTQKLISWIWYCPFFWKISRWFCPNPATVYSALDSRHGKKIKHDIGRPPPFQYGPFSTGLPFTTTRSGERLCSIWCVPSTVITASQKPTIATYYTNILLLTNITTWKKKSQHC